MRKTWGFALSDVPSTPKDIGASLKTHGPGLRDHEMWWGSLSIPGFPVECVLTHSRFWYPGARSP